MTTQEGTAAMTSSTDKIQAVNDGTTTKDPKTPVHGLALLRRMEAQGLIRVINDALYETETLTRDMGEHLRGDSSDVSDAQLGSQLLEALACLETADHYLRMLDSVIDTGEPLSEAPIPFR
jgi:hypothetical protein